MLLQSHRGTMQVPVIDLLPALPVAWPDGEVEGLRARGGYTVGMKWKDGKLTEAVIEASEQSPRQLAVSYRQDTKIWDIRPGERITVKF